MRGLANLALPPCSPPSLPLACPAPPLHGLRGGCRVPFPPLPAPTWLTAATREPPISPLQG
ncbi:hypothetical protein BCV69DRAFT_280760 [Microstroma glucosiphilum]|uniref:Uncharacterized protein n=1 Tax=Pseudomicrostroma glucosiphilum TaxID=1684307 RepID=A0A316UE50_9BASI|nr:hypothetical protein BCV69DRAFT_280760 [Pseudomicrostroma glucosiphilum]PWN23144.1 hypothetical protein BCV69DRAFT_280760 [Pseudomicrostroma glucosiphilum]